MDQTTSDGKRSQASNGNLPIGVFDSGIGGLSVLKPLAVQFPNESFLYIGDTARLPYGTKSADTIRKYSEQMLNYLVEQKVKALVIACNSASSQVPESEWQGIPVYNVIYPGALLAAQLTKNQRIGVLGTRATVQSQSYTRALHAIEPRLQVSSQAAPLFVPLAEEGWVDDPITNLIAYRYCQPLIHAQVDTVVLGCTHYPLLKQSIAKCLGNQVNLIDCGQAVAALLQNDFNSGRLTKTTQAKGKIQVWCTDLSSQFELMANSIMSPITIDELKACYP